LVQALVKLETFQRTSSFYTWLYRITMNLALSRRRRRREVASLDALRNGAGHEPLDGSPAPDAHLHQQQRASLVQAALATLPEEFRAVVVLRDMDELSYEQISEILDLPIGTVRSRLHRGRLQLHELLSAYLDNELEGAERARCEEYLAANPAARQLLDELRAGREALRQIPQQSLGADFAQRVVRRAEREVLVPAVSTDRAPRPINLPGERARLRVASSEPTRFDWQRARRPLFYVALVTAAALLVMIFNPNRDQRGEHLAELPANLEIHATDKNEAGKNETVADRERVAGVDKLARNLDRDAGSAPAKPMSATAAAPAPAPATIPAAAPPAATTPAAVNVTNALAATANQRGDQAQAQLSFQVDVVNRYADPVLEQTGVNLRAPQPELDAKTAPVTVIRCDIRRAAFQPQQVSHWFAAAAIDSIDAGASYQYGLTDSAAKQADEAESRKLAENRPALAARKEPKPARENLSAPVADNYASGAQRALAAAAAPGGAGGNEPVEVFFCQASPEQLTAAVQVLQSQQAVVDVQVYPSAAGKETFGYLSAPSQNMSEDRKKAAAVDDAPAKMARSPAPASSLAPSASPAPTAAPASAAAGAMPALNQTAQQAAQGALRKSQQEGRGYAQRIELGPVAQRQQLGRQSSQGAYGAAAAPAEEKTIASRRAGLAGDEAAKAKASESQVRGGEAERVKLFYESTAQQQAVFVFRLVDAPPAQASSPPVAAPLDAAKPAEPAKPPAKP
jgi:RNA polymerase sigma-70 factor (ECF subfamily)